MTGRRWRRPPSSGSENITCIYQSMDIRRSFVWRKLRERKILATHRRVAAICEKLISDYNQSGRDYDIKAKKSFDNDKIIWQYWAQGYDNIPEVVSKCLKSVKQYAPDYQIIRLTANNLNEYLDIPEFIHKKRLLYSKAHFSDILRLMLLKAYGGIWMDATILLTGPIPKEITSYDFFVFRRDPAEPNYKYWRNTYAYYFGWAEGFRVNMLNSFIVAKKGNKTVGDLCNLMLYWWETQDALPDYFFFQILFDTYECKEDYPLISDCIPHYLQQSYNDPIRFRLSEYEIYERTSIHKLTYK